MTSWHSPPMRVKREEPEHSGGWLGHGHNACEDIPLELVDAFKRVQQMVETIDRDIRFMLPFSSNLRKEVLLNEIDRLRIRGSDPPQSLIAFCGGMGTGKSSLINAILGDNIVPTSAMAACTAVVTQVCYHDHGDMIEAEITYLSREQWEDELGDLLYDLREEPRNDRAGTRPNEPEEALAAWHKIHAVYPAVSEEELRSATPQQLLSLNAAVTRLLGTKSRIAAHTSDRFSEMLLQYLPPPEHPTWDARTGSSDSPTEGRLPACWPLVRELVIRCNSPVLASGAVLVDLPGTADANAARCRIAQDYMRRANRFFIISQISRAVDDKAAKVLCGEAFKLQLKLDGNYTRDAITFVATKCDDISADEVIRNMRLGSDVELQKFEAELRDAKVSRDAWNKNLDEYMDRLDSLKAAMQLLDATGLTQRKRKSESDTNNQGEPLKKTKRVTSSTQPALSTLYQQPLDPKAESVYSMPHSELRELRKKIRAEERNVSSARSSVKIAEDKWAKAMASKNRFCAIRRSEWTKRRLQKDFEAGLEEFEDYDQVGNTASLPVFTCSSRDFLRIIGKASDGNPACFNDEEDTGIPSLRDWIHQLTLPAREKEARDTFLQLRAFARSLLDYIQGQPHMTEQERLLLRDQWQSKETLRQPPDSKVSSRQRRIAAYKVRPYSFVARINTNAASIVDDITHGLNKTLISSLQEKCREGAIIASSSAVKTSDEMALRVRWNTYRAILRRNGAFRDNDLNIELTLPFTRRIASLWSQLFSAKHFAILVTQVPELISRLLDELVVSVPTHLHARAQELAQTALQAARADLPRVSNAVQKTLNEHQQCISRSVAPFVQKHLQDSYQQVASFAGNGCFARQKNTFRTHLEARRSTMFNDAATALPREVEMAVHDVGEALDAEIEKLAQKVEVHMSALWETSAESAGDQKTRVGVKAMLEDIIRAIDRWIEAKDQEVDARSAQDRRSSSLEYV